MRNSESRPRRTERKGSRLKHDCSALSTPTRHLIIYSLLINVFSAFLLCMNPNSRGRLAFLPIVELLWGRGSNSL
jgi:hypothetical protein